MEQQQNQTKTIREHYAHNKLWMYVKLNHNLMLDHEQLERLVKAVEQYKKDLSDGMVSNETLNY